MRLALAVTNLSLSGSSTNKYDPAESGIMVYKTAAMEGLVEQGLFDAKLRYESWATGFAGVKMDNRGNVEHAWTKLTAQVRGSLLALD